MLNKKRNILIICCFLITACYFLLPSQKNFELYAIQYGESLFSTKKIFDDIKDNTQVPFAWLFYVLKIDEKIILIDTGFSDEKKIKKYNINFQNPIELLRKSNINPEQITDIIITHSHFDHMGNVDQFDNAKIYISQTELTNFLKNTSNQKTKDFLIDNNNLITFDNEINLFDTIKIKEIGGHTQGSSVVFIYNDNNKYVLTGDECYLIENCIQARPIGSLYDHEKNKIFIETISRSNYEILTFHDPKIFKKYERIFDWMVKIK